MEYISIQKYYEIILNLTSIFLQNNNNNILSLNFRTTDENISYFDVIIIYFIFFQLIMLILLNRMK